MNNLPFKRDTGIPFKRFGVRTDCSRNAVWSIPALKKWIDIISKLGYNTLTLYCEDTYEIEGEPYFGYGRGRFTKDELKELNAYAREREVEMIPGTNTLAHLGSIFRWAHYAEINDNADILLCEDERTYALIEKMIATAAECFDSRVIDINMDEADMLGRGKYYAKHGPDKRIEILKRHMNRVCEIARKYGFEMIMISGDMSFRLATHSESYSNTKAVVQEDVSDLIPEGAVLKYWDYYKRSKEDYTALTRVHQQIKREGLWYQCGVWTWHAFSPENNYSTGAIRNSLQAAMENGVENINVCFFGDDGGECARFAGLPGLFYASQIAKGIDDEATIKANFEKEFGIPYDQFLLIDLTQRNETEEYCVHPTRYILYNDPFIGLMDMTLPESTRADHEELVKLLAPLCKNKQWGYLFQTMHDLCAVTAEKCDIGTRIRAAYDAGDKKQLKKLARELRRIRDLVEKFYYSFRKQWMTENKPHGFDVSDVRIGGVMTRLVHCAERLDEYVAGNVDRIEELEETLLDVRTPLSPDYGKRKYLNYWDRNSRYYTEIVSANWVGKGF